MIELLGWAATVIFVGSYFCRQSSALRAFQIGGALVWICYGVLIGASPVIAANILVCCAAAWSLHRDRAAEIRSRT